MLSIDSRPDVYNTLAPADLGRCACGILPTFPQSDIQQWRAFVPLLSFFRHSIRCIENYNIIFIITCWNPQLTVGCSWCNFHQDLMFWWEASSELASIQQAIAKSPPLEVARIATWVDSDFSSHCTPIIMTASGCCNDVTQTRHYDQQESRCKIINKLTAGQVRMLLAVI